MSATATFEPVRHTMLVCVDPKSNANKFYEIRLAPDDTVHVRYGRVGEPGVTRTYSGGAGEFAKIARAKERKGYAEAAILTGTARQEPVAKSEAARKAREDLAGSGDKRLTSLIDRIVAANAHEISALSGGKVTVTDGQVQTPLGLLTRSALSEADEVLTRLAADATSPSLLSRYLTLVPQSVGRGRDWTASFFSGERTVTQQRAFIEQLRQSLDYSEKVAEAGRRSTSATGDAARVFAYTLSVVEDADVLAEVEKRYRGSLNRNHASASMQVKNVYAVSAPSQEATFDATSTRIGNVRRMWHGTRSANVLSILASGMKVPGRHASHVTGRMFGDGLYFSEQSTKSLNYSRGGVWSSGVERRALMFVADVAMGWEYRPGIHPTLSHGASYNTVLDGKKTDSATGRRFDSVNVKAGSGGVRNHEAIVPGPSHVALRYLVEFEG